MKTISESGALDPNPTNARQQRRQREAGMRAALAEATKLRSRALHLAAEDVKAFGLVAGGRGRKNWSHVEPRSSTR